jgi:hypothetical protein
MQTLTKENSPLLSTLSSPNVQKALENAPASDIVQLSEQALQLQATDALFGISNTSNSPTDSLFSALANVGSSASSSASGSSLNPGSPLADQLAANQRQHADTRDPNPLRHRHAKFVVRRIRLIPLSTRPVPASRARQWLLPQARIAGSCCGRRLPGSWSCPRKS